MKLQLVRTKDDFKFSNRPSEDAIFPPPTGLCLIACYVEKFLPNTFIEIIDEYSVKNIVNFLDGDCVGFSVQYTNYMNSLKTAKECKEKSPRTKIIFGGPYASNLAKRILHNNWFVDYVIVGDAEESILGVLKGNNIVSIPNILYRDGKRIAFTFFKNVGMASLPLFDFRHVKNNFDVKEYRFSRTHGIPTIVTGFIRGCVKSSTYGKCSFCAIPFNNRVRLTPPENFWRQISHLKKLYKINRFFESGDVFTVGDYPKRLLESKPSGISVSFDIYNTVNGLDKRNIEIIKQISIEQVFLGIEHINQNILKDITKEHTVDEIQNVVKTLQENHINVQPSFVFGLPGETTDTAQENFDFAEKLCKNYSNVKLILSSICTPLIGTKIFDEMVSNHDALSEYNTQGKNLELDDIIDYNLLTKIMLSIYTGISYKDAQKYALITAKLLPENKRGYGFGEL